jgi:LSD1 subclass zinc finger protein
MNILKTTCPKCQMPLEFPRDFDNVICAFCETAFNVRDYKGTINLSPTNKSAEFLPSGLGEARDAMAFVEARLGELDELIAEVGSEVEVLKSREQSAPLQKGCSFFGLFLLVITIIVLFMPLGRKYFGNWLFYLALAAVIILGIRRIRLRLQSPAQLKKISEERLRLEEGLAQLESERSRVIKLREKLLKL